MLPAERDDNAAIFLFNGRTALMEPHHLVDDGESEAGSRLVTRIIAAAPWLEEVDLRVNCPLIGEDQLILCNLPSHRRRGGGERILEQLSCGMGEEEWIGVEIGIGSVDVDSFSLPFRYCFEAALDELLEIGRASCRERV